MAPQRLDVLAGVRHVLFVHAHPDDETLATGALMAELVDAGVGVTLVTCTRGERGEVVSGSQAPPEGTPEFAAHREGELAGALAELGVTRHVYLGTPPARAPRLDPRRYEDSGMRWVREGLAGPADDATSLSLTSAPAADAVADLLALIAADTPCDPTITPEAARRSQERHDLTIPGRLTSRTDAAASVRDLIVSYNEIGGYGHPDHVRAREIAEEAARARGIRFAEIIGDASCIQTAQDAGELATWFELDHRLGHVKRALAHHASQVTVDGEDVVHSGGQRTPLETSVGLRVVS